MFGAIRAEAAPGLQMGFRSQQFVFIETTGVSFPIFRNLTVGTCVFKRANVRYCGLGLGVKIRR